MVPKAFLVTLSLALAATAADAQQRGQRSDSLEPDRPAPAVPDAAPAQSEAAPVVRGGDATSAARKPNVSPVVFARLRTTMLNNESLGPREDGMFCRSAGNFVMGPRTWEALTRGAARAFRTELTRAGYPNPYASESAFDDNRRPQTDFEIGATVQRASVKLCMNGRQAQGNVSVETKWELYSKKARKVVFQTVTEGSYQNSQPEAMAFSDWWERAFAVAVRSLVADPKLADYLSGATSIPAADPAAVAARDVIVLPTTAALTGGVPQNATLLRAAVVTINSGKGHGSGFFVSPQGYIITNHHVVGDIKFVKVHLASGREVIGEVVKSDRRRDVALVKTEPISLHPLGIRTTEANIGEELYAIGAPLSEKFSGSLTRGILSGHRTLDDQRFIQSDVTVMPGSSGGPLLDAAGRVVGITRGGIVSGAGNVNLFVPIGDALSTLAVEVQQ
jgi:S1-C subfamily serine protease